MKRLLQKQIDREFEQSVAFNLFLAVTDKLA